MNSRDLFNAMGGIDENLIARSESKERIIKMKNKNIIFKRILPVAACLAIAAGTMFGLSGNIGINYNTEKSSSASRASCFGLVIASAKDDGTVSYNMIDMGKGYGIELPIKCRFKIERVKGFSVEEKNKIFDRLVAEDYEYSKNANGSYSGTTSLSETENSIYTVNSVEYFSFNITKPELLKKITVSGSGNYFFTKNTSTTVTGGADEGRTLTIIGDEYRADNSTGIMWTPSEELIEEFENNEALKVSDIQDSLKFTAFYTDGTTEVITVDISFDGNGIMKAVCNR